MKSKILGLVLGLSLCGAAHAQSCADKLQTGAKQSSAQAAAFCSTLQSAITGDLAFATSGKTLAIQEATAASACSGTLTLNGATPVVTSTTCATTGSRIFLTRTSVETTALNPYVSAISTGVSFSVTSEAGDTGTMNWFIVHEAP